MCAGLQVTFDREVELRGVHGMMRGMRSGFEVLNDIAAADAAAIDPKFHPQPTPQCPLLLWPNCSACACQQTVAVTGQAGPRTVQLNTTFVSGRPALLRYGWDDDYPTMIVYAKDDGRPAAPFNVSIPFSHID